MKTSPSGFLPDQPYLHNPCNMEGERRGNTRTVEARREHSCQTRVGLVQRSLSLDVMPQNPSQALTQIHLCPNPEQNVPEAEHKGPGVSNAFADPDRLEDDFVPCFRVARFRHGACGIACLTEGLRKDGKPSSQISFFWLGV